MNNLQKIKNHIKEVMWENAHDKGLLEHLIRYIKKLEEEE